MEAVISMTLKIKLISKTNKKIYYLSPVYGLQSIGRITFTINLFTFVSCDVRVTYVVKDSASFQGVPSVNRCGA